MSRIVEEVIDWFRENFKEREAKLTALQYAVATAMFLGLIDVESMELVKDILRQILKDADAVTAGATAIRTDGLNQLAAIGLLHFASEGFKKSRGQAKSGRG